MNSEVVAGKIKKLEAKKKLLQRKCCELSEKEFLISDELDKLRAKFLRLNASALLSPFKWEFRLRDTSFSLHAIGLRNATMTLEASAKGQSDYTAAIDAIYDVCKFGWDHDGFDIEKGVIIRTDDRDLSLVFSSFTRGIGFLKLSGLFDDVSFSHLDGVIDRKEELFNTLVSDLKLLKELRNNLLLKI